MDNIRKENDGFIDSVIGASTTENVERFGRASSQYIKGYRGVVDDNGHIVRKGLKQVHESKVHPDFTYQNIKQQAGFSAEIQYVANTNAENIINKNNVRVNRSNDLGRGNDTQFDILSIDADGNPTWGAQMKFCGKFSTPDEIKSSSEALVKNMVSDKWDRYRGRPLLVPEEQYALAKAYAEKKYKELSLQAVKNRTSGNTAKAELLEQKSENYLQASKDLQNSGLTSEYAMSLRERPKLETAKCVVKTANLSGIENVKSAAIVSFTISTAQNVICLIRGEKEADEAVKLIAMDVAIGSATGYLTGFGDTIIRGFLNATKENSVFYNLSRSNMPAMIATTTVQVGKSLIRFASGEIDGLELVKELGEKSIGMMAAGFGAAVGTAIFPGVGTVIGGMGGYMASSILYNACMKVLGDEQISIQRRNKISAISSAAVESLNMQGDKLLEIINKFYSNRYKLFSESLLMINLASLSGDIELFTQGVNNIAIEMGGVLQFKNFVEFNSFMGNKQMSLEF